MKLYIVTGFSLGPLSRAIAFTVSGRSYVSKHRTLTSPFFLARLPTMFNRRFRDFLPNNHTISTSTNEWCAKNNSILPPILPGKHSARLSEHINRTAG